MSTGQGAPGPYSRSMAPVHAEVTAWVAPEAEEGAGIQFMELERIFYCP